LSEHGLPTSKFTCVCNVYSEVSTNRKLDLN